MSDRPRDLIHPDALLAVYVDDSASHDERALVEAHLETCPRCRADVSLARSARTALGRLPQLEAPGLADLITADLGISGEAGEAAGPGADRRGTFLTRLRSGQVLWGAGAAAAAVLVGLGIYLGVVAISRGGGAPTALSVPPGGAATSPHAAAGPDFTATEVDALVQRLAGGDRSSGEAASSSGSPPSAIADHIRGATDTATAFRPASTPAQLRPESSVDCVRQAGGLSDDAPLVELIDAATFEGTPASIGAFIDRSHDRLVAVVADRSSCVALYVASAPL